MRRWLLGVALLIVGLASGVLLSAQPEVRVAAQKYAGEIVVLLVSLVAGVIASAIILRVRDLGPFVPELLVLIVGLITGLIAAVAITEKAIAVVAVLISFLLAVSTFSLKREISFRVAAVSRLHLALSSIHNSRWRAEAGEKIEELEIEVSGWAAGHRMLPHERSIPYQIDLLSTASRSVDAIHIALDHKALMLWDRDSGKFSAMVEAHANLAKSVAKRRIIVVDDGDSGMVTKVDGSRRISDQDAIRVCRHQIAPTPEGLGVDLRILWKSHVARVDREPPRDLLLVDDAEAVVVTIREETGQGNAAAGHKYETSVYVDPISVRSHRRRFDSYWAVATPASSALPSEPAGKPLPDHSTGGA